MVATRVASGSRSPPPRARAASPHRSSDRRAEAVDDAAARVGLAAGGGGVGRHRARGALYGSRGRASVEQSRPVLARRLVRSARAYRVMPLRPVVPAPSRLRRRPATRRARRRRPPPPPPDVDVALRLAIGREGIGLELARPARLGCLVGDRARGDAAGRALPGGRLGRRAALPPPARRAAAAGGGARRAVARALGGAAAAGPRGHARAGGVDRRSRGGGDRRASSQRAGPGGRGARARRRCWRSTCTRWPRRGPRARRGAGARGGPAAPATALAVGVRRGAAGRRRGAAGRGVRRCETARGAIARALLPEAGARVPAAEDVRWTSVAARERHLGAPRRAGSASRRRRARRRSARARSRCSCGRPTTRSCAATRRRRAPLCVDALERAPRHAEIVRRIVDIDVRGGRPGRGRARDARRRRAPGHDAADARFGTTARRAARSRRATPRRRSRAWSAPATPSRRLPSRRAPTSSRPALARDPEDAARWLDRALARVAAVGVGALAARRASAWSSAGSRTRSADVEHLEAQARGGAREAPGVAARRARVAARRGSRRTGGRRSSSGRCGTCRTSRARWRASAWRSSATGREARGVAVLERRAARWPRREHEPTSRHPLDLGRALAEQARRSADGGRARRRDPGRRARGPARARPRGPLARAPRRPGRRGASSFARLRELAASLRARPRTTPHAATVAALLARGGRDRAARACAIRSRRSATSRRRFASARATPSSCAPTATSARWSPRAPRGRARGPRRRRTPPDRLPGVEDRSATHRTLTDRPPARRRLFDLALAAGRRRAGRARPRRASRS